MTQKPITTSATAILTRLRQITLIPAPVPRFKPTDAGATTIGAVPILAPEGLRTILVPMPEKPNAEHLATIVRTALPVAHLTPDPTSALPNAVLAIVVPTAVPEVLRAAFHVREIMFQLMWVRQNAVPDVTNASTILTVPSLQNHALTDALHLILVGNVLPVNLARLTKMKRGALMEQRLVLTVVEEQELVARIALPVILHLQPQNTNI